MPASTKAGSTSSSSPPIAAASSSVTVSSQDIVRLIMQFLSERGLTNTLRTLRTETGVSLDALSIRDREALSSAVRQGRWPAVLRLTAAVKLTAETQTTLYEQVALELIEQREYSAARALIRGAAPLARLQRSSPSRLRGLQHWATPATSFDALQAYGTSSLGNGAAIAVKTVRGGGGGNSARQRRR